MILQEFDLEFVSAKSKKSLIFAKLISYFPSLDEGEVHEDSFIDEYIFSHFDSGPMVWGHYLLFANLEGSFSPFAR